MGLLSRLTSALTGRDVPDDIRECRDCGTLVPPREETCPNCESGRIATYDV